MPDGHERAGLCSSLSSLLSERSPHPPSSPPPTLPLYSQLFSRYVDQALEAVSTDEYPWVEFSFYPCPGAVVAVCCFFCCCSSPSSRSISGPLRPPWPLLVLVTCGVGREECLPISRLFKAAPDCPHSIPNLITLLCVLSPPQKTGSVVDSRALLSPSPPAHDTHPPLSFSLLCPICGVSCDFVSGIRVSLRHTTPSLPPPLYACTSTHQIGSLPPTGAPTPAQCVPDVPFKGVNVDCCKNDKFEACMVSLCALPQLPPFCLSDLSRSSLWRPPPTYR